MGKETPGEYIRRIRKEREVAVMSEDVKAQLQKNTEKALNNAYIIDLGHPTGDVLLQGHSKSLWEATSNERDARVMAWSSILEDVRAELGLADESVEQTGSTESLNSQGDAERT